MTTGRHRDEADRSRGFERFLTFVDAVVAIAITLLVLPLADVAGDVNHGQRVSAVIAHHGGEFYAFALSFAVIASLWRSHHRIVADVLDEHPAVMGWTFVWLLAIVFLPFPTALLSAAGSQSLTKVLYLGTMAVAAASLAALRWVVDHRPSIREPGTAAHPYAFVESVVNVALFVLTLVVSLSVPRIGYWALAVLALSGPITELVKRVRSRSAS